MITTRLQGGIGNQMFQLAMGYAQAQRLGVGLRLDVSLLGGLRKYQLDQWISFSQWEVISGSRATVNESGMPYNQGLVGQIKDGDVLNGYWQTEKYFLSVEKRLRTFFYPRENSETGRMQEQKQMIEGESECVMVHVRRGDYLIEPYHSYHGVLPLSYYTSAMNHIRRTITSPRFFVFSDDLDWVRKNLASEDVTIMDVPQESHAIYLMSRCRHSIIANSSFSWWGAWIGYGKKDGIHIAPKRWFAQSKEDTRDIVPEVWDKIDILENVQTSEQKKVLFAVNSWDEDARRGCHQAVRETWGKNVSPAHLRFFVPTVSNHIYLADEVNVDVSRDYDFVSREVLEILRWSLQQGYEYTVLTSNDVFILPQKLLNCGFEGYDYCGFFHEPNVPLGAIAPYDYKCNFNTEGGYGVERKLYNWADGGDGRILSRKAAKYIVESPDAAAYWFAADDIFIGQVLGPHINTGEIKAKNLGFHKDDAVPDNGMTWHFKNYAEHRGVRYDPKDGWLRKMYGEHR